MIVRFNFEVTDYARYEVCVDDERYLEWLNGARPDDTNLAEYVRENHQWQLKYMSEAAKVRDHRDAVVIFRGVEMDDEYKMRLRECPGCLGFNAFEHDEHKWTESGTNFWCTGLI